MVYDSSSFYLVTMWGLTQFESLAYNGNKNRRFFHSKRKIRKIFSVFLIRGCDSCDVTVVLPVELVDSGSALLFCGVNIAIGNTERTLSSQITGDADSANLFRLGFKGMT